MSVIEEIKISEKIIEINKKRDIIFNEIIKNKENDEKNDYPYVVVQELLQDPYTISGRKINLRVYVLVVKNNNKTNLYIYSDGFMYYTAELFQKNSTDTKINITTGYIDRKVYEENPLTHNDFKSYLDSDRNYNTTEQKNKFDKQKCLMIGDNLETDIQFGINANID